MNDKPEACIGCSFYGNGKGFVNDELRPDAKVALLAQNPGDTEENLGRPLIGRTGQMVQNDLARYGLKREDCSYLNVIKCRWCPPGSKTKVNILPEGAITHEAAKHCVSAYLLPNLKQIKPNLVALMGEIALFYGAGHHEVASWRGSVFIAESGACTGRKVMPMIHPAALYRDLSWRTAYKQDFIRLVREKDSPTPVIVYKDHFRVGVGPGEFCATLKKLSGQLVALDIETSKHKPIEAKLHTIGIAWSKEDAMNYFFGMDEESDKHVLDALSSFDGEFVTATPFDYSVLRKLGVRFTWDKCHDLTLLHSRFDIELPHDVGFVCSMFTNRPFWKWMNVVDPGRYNALDCVGEWEAFTTLKTYCQQKDPKVWKIYNEDRRLLPVEVDLHLNGFPTEKKLIEEEREWYDRRREKIQEVLMVEFTPKQVPVEPEACPVHKRYSGRTPVKQRKGESELCSHCGTIFKFRQESKPVNLRSRQRLMKILKADGMKMLKDKETGKDSLAKGKVADLYKKYGDPRLLKLLEFWEMDTVISRYFKEAWITKATGRIHPTYSMHSAMHRWHCSGPNMQQQRKPEREITTDGTVRFRGPRATIQAPLTRFFIDFDADGLHLRIAAAASQDKFLLEALEKYDETGDEQYKPHIQNMSALFHMNVDECIALMESKSPKYTFSKNFIYLILNGGDVPALRNAAVSAGLEMDEKEVKRMLDAWLERANGFKAWRERLVEEAKKTGCITLPSGRRRRFYGIRWDGRTNQMKIDAATLKEIYNAPLIGTEADFMNPRLRLVWDLTQGTNWFMFDQEHDGFMLEGPKEEARVFGHFLLEKIPVRHEYAPGISLYVPFSFKGGDNWAYLGKVNGDEKATVGEDV